MTRVLVSTVAALFVVLSFVGKALAARGYMTRHDANRWDALAAIAIGAWLIYMIVSAK